MSVDEPKRQFVDSNVLVYSFDGTAGEKRRRAQGLLGDLWRERSGCLSIQVLQEFYVVVTRRLRPPLSLSEAAGKVAYFSEWNLHTPARSDLLSAIDLQEEFRISLWDAMIVQSARRMGCSLLWTEDLNNGQRYAGVLVRNPFVDSVMER